MAAPPLASAIQAYGDHDGAVVRAGAIRVVFELLITMTSSVSNQVQRPGPSGCVASAVRIPPLRHDADADRRRVIVGEDVTAVCAVVR
jgi:hypothetical protein